MPADATAPNLRLMAAAAEHAPRRPHAAAPGPGAPPPPRPKLVLPCLTPAMEQDLDRAKAAGAGSAARPLALGARPEFADYPLRDVATPHPHDVLCGRGGGSNNHPGNEAFRALVNEVKLPYVRCPKREKPLIARRVVEAVRNQTPPGRFLAKDAATGRWRDIGDGKAREKTSQALREGAPVLRDLRGPADGGGGGGGGGAGELAARALREAKRAGRAGKGGGGTSNGNDNNNGNGNGNGNGTLPCDDISAYYKDGHPTEGAGADFAAAVQRGQHLPHQRGAPPAEAQHQHNQASPSLSLPTSGALAAQRNVNVGRPSLPMQRFISYGEPSGPPPQPAWQSLPSRPPQPARCFSDFGATSYAHPRDPTAGGAGGYAAPPPRGPSEYAPGRAGPPGAVPLDTVRRLLLGQLDPVQLAVQLLSPEEVAFVARRHAHAPAAGASLAPPIHNVAPPPVPPKEVAFLARRHARAPAAQPPLPQPVHSAPPPPQSRRPPLPLRPVVSDGSASDASPGAGAGRPGTTAPPSGAPQGGGDDDGSSVESKQSQSSRENRTLPKKKRKYVAVE